MRNKTKEEKVIEKVVGTLTNVKTGEKMLIIEKNGKTYSLSKTKK